MKSLLILILLIPVLSTAQVAGKARAGWNTYKTNTYSVAYPADWAIDTSKAMGIDVFLFSPLDSTKDKFRENVNVLSSSFGGDDISLDSFFHVSERQIKMSATDCVILESKLYTTGQSNFYKIDFTAKQGIFQLRFVQYYFVKNASGFTITLSSEEAAYPKHEATGLAVLNSFVLN